MNYLFGFRLSCRDGMIDAGDVGSLGLATNGILIFSIDSRFDVLSRQVFS